ncbi:Lipase 3 [Orchesella cincta]|uniref:Lipase 3 n=1 Tax=Orchesella cincta TaxID=48709 RepID=A0A1D2N8Q6_ORCCI|nr:Lipase 3 [Orchesella cincta]
MKFNLGSARSSGLFFTSFLAYSQIPLVIYVLLVAPLGQCEVEGTDLVHSFLYEHSRRFFDFVSRTTLVRKLFGGDEPITTSKLIENQGYPSETHRVTTEDGFILEMHRIPYGLRQKYPQQQSRPPVIVFHGNAQSSADWVVNTPNEDALGFYLADSGYDVWLVNQRGNEYSTRHVSLTTSDSKFWDHSVHEMGVYDVPAMINYITAYTGHQKVHYIGFSLSCSSILIALAKRPEFNHKVGAVVLLAPGVFFQGFFFGLAKFAAPAAGLYEVFGKFLGGIPLIPHFVTNLLHRVLPVYCHPKVDLLGTCVLFIRIFFGDDRGLITQDKMPRITMVAPSTFSVKSAIHGLQQVGTGGFHEYDYGISRNKLIYGRTRPPDYNLTNVRVPVALMVGEKDFLATARDAKILARKLPNVIDFHVVNNPNFYHLDFCYGRGTSKLVNSRVVQTLDAYSYGWSYG